MRILDADEAAVWAVAGLGLARVATDAEGLARAVPGVLAALDEVPALPPVGAIVDLGLLLSGARAMASATTVAAGGRRLAAAIRAYEDEWLGRLATDPRREAAVDAMLRLPEGLRAKGIAVTLASVLARVRFDGGVEASAAAVRRRLAGPIDRAALALVAASTPAVVALAEGYEGLARAGRAAPRLLDDPDLFVLQHLEALGPAAQRVAITQALEVTAELDRALPRVIRPRIHRPAGATLTADDDESAYPAGGFSSVTTTGSLENLVTSELVFMEDDAAIDLFDVRYAEGELLYYARDEALHLRPRRTIVLVLDPSLAALRFKDPELVWQRVVILVGALACVVRRLVERLTAEDLRIDLVFVHDAVGGAPLALERGLVGTLLRGLRDRGVAVRDAALEDLASELGEQVRKRRIDVVFVGPAARGLTLEARVPGAEHLGFDAAALGPDWAAWVHASTGLVADLL